jgi:type I site-specific restriction-modification system R (restriction) subunit
LVGCLEQTDYVTFGFAEALMEACHLAKMITKYVVLNESQKVLMVLRPYQYYATEAIIESVKTSKKFGYILAYHRVRENNAIQA